MYKLSEDELSYELELKYLENLVERVIRSESDVFYGHATSQVLSVADIREPAETADFTDMHELLLENIRGWKQLAGFADLIKQVQALLSKISIQFRQCKGLRPMFSSSCIVVLGLSTAYLIDEVDESLSLFPPKIPCGGNPG